jgi:hypothetical protein
MLTGCGTQYSLLYKTDVVTAFKNDSSEPLTFAIDPLYNGIIFTVRNNSDQTARIIWDKSYFIMPDGNSYKALNTDILKEEKEIVHKAKYVSTIPSKASFTRFTTSSLNADKIRTGEAYGFATTWQNYTSVHIKYLVEDFIRYGSYWAITVKVDPFASSPGQTEEAAELNALIPIGNSVRKNNNLGLGLVIEHRGKEKEYRFDIKITKVHAVKKVNVSEENKSYKEKSAEKDISHQTKYILDYTFDVPSNKWEKVGIELKD